MGVIEDLDTAVLVKAQDTKSYKSRPIWECFTWKFVDKIVYRVYPNSTDKLSGQILRSKISIKLLIQMWLKTLSLRDNQQKRKNNYDLNSLDFMGLSVDWRGDGRNFDNFCKLYIAPLYFCTFHQKIPFVAGRTF
jgi:hypothetical protein